MKRKFIVMLGTCAVLVVVGLVPNAFCNPTMEGDPFLGNSWGFTAVTAPGAYDLVAVRISAGSDVFESPALRNVSQPGWQMSLETPTIASMTGPMTTSGLKWDVWFAGDAPTSLELDWAIFRGEQLVIATHWWLDANGKLAKWEYSQNWQPTRADVVAAVPAPGAILLGGLGTTLVGWLRRRRVL